MYTAIIATVCLACLIIFTIVLTFYTANVKTNVDKKLRDVVDQINNSNYYQFELERQSHDKINTLDNNVANVRSKYLPRAEAQERVTTNLLDTKNIYQHDGNVKLDQSTVTFDNAFTLKSDKNSLQWKIPSNKSMKFDDEAGNNVMNIGKDVSIPNAKTNKLQIGDKHQLLSDGDYVKLFDKDGKNYFGGFAAANIYSVDSIIGNAAEFNKASVKNSLTLTGGNSEHNPNNWKTHFPWDSDGKNYIRGDTSVRGNASVVGDIAVGRDVSVGNLLQAKNIQASNIKLGHNWKGTWWDESPLTVYSQGIGASFGNEYFSHFSGADGNTYIRPGKTGGSIVVGDVGNTSSIKLGDDNTTTKIMGSMCVGNTCFTKDDMTKVKQNTDINLIELQKTLQEKLATAQNQIDALAQEKANQQIVQYQQEQAAREKSLQEQIDDLNVALNALKTKIGI